jgi:hypothetical protein
MLPEKFFFDCVAPVFHTIGGRFIAVRRKQGVKNRTINYGLQVVRHILNLATSDWMDEHGLIWLSAAPKIYFIYPLHLKMRTKVKAEFESYQ